MTTNHEILEAFEDYGFVPDRAAALAEQFPPLDRLLLESPSHPAQRAAREEWTERMSSPVGRRIAEMSVSTQKVTDWQNAEADRFIAQQKRRTPTPPTELRDLAQESVNQLKARYGGPSTFKETQ